MTLQLALDIIKLISSITPIYNSYSRQIAFKI